MKIAIVYPDDFSIWHFHRDLITELMYRNNIVYTLSKKSNYSKKLIEIGAISVPMPFSRFFDPIADIRLFASLFSFFKNEKPDIVHCFTIKANTYGIIAAKMAGVKKIIGTAEGLGFIFSDDLDKRYIFLKPIALLLYKIGCMACDKFWFVNPDDMNYFLKKSMINKEKVFLTISAGVNTERYSIKYVNEEKKDLLRNELKINRHERIVLLVVARVLWSKGIREFIEAAEKLQNENIRFLLVGPLEEGSPDSVPIEFLREAEKMNNFNWLGFRRDILNLYSIADIVTLPSKYREGVPNVLLEAMALGKPIITTDNVGCREVIEDGENGYMIEKNSSVELKDAILKIIKNKKRMMKFGKKSRSMVESRFNKLKIINEVIENLYCDNKK